MKNRRDFLKEVCPTVAFAFFGLSFLEACSSDSLEDDTGNGTTQPPNNTGFLIVAIQRAALLIPLI